jgi:hypothetical protein
VTWIAAIAITLAAMPMPMAAQATRPVAFGSSCSALIGLESPTSIVTYTIRHSGGTFVPPETGTAPVSGRPPFNALPEFCRAVVTARPPGAAPVEIELWLPTETWNGRLWAVGREDPLGALDFAAMAAWLARGAVVVAMRTPMRSSGATAGALHEMTSAAKSVATAFFGQGPRWSYWIGCARGADAGLAVAERFPEDFDGILAGSSAVGGSAARPDLTRFATLAGKLLLFGTASVSERVRTGASGIPAASVRWFALPVDRGCIAAEDAAMSALAVALQDWVERGIVPKQIQ